MLDNENTGSGFNQLSESRQELVDVVEVQAGGGLVENEERILAGRVGQVRGQADALGLAARERGGRLPQPQVA